MKLIVLIALVCASALAQESSFTNGRPFRVWFEHVPQDAPHTAYYVHQSTNISLPVEQWQEFSTGWFLTNSTPPAMVSSNVFPTHLPMTFYTVSASNEWGRVFSEPFTSAPPRTVRVGGLIPAN